MEKRYIVKGGKRILVHAGATLIERKAKYAYCITHGLSSDEAKRLMDIPWDYFEKEVINSKNRGIKG